MRRWQILLVDGDGAERACALEAAREFADDLDLRAVASVADALLLLGAGRAPDLALIDLGLGDEHCHELIEALRRLPRPVASVVLSACDDEIAHENCLHAGAGDFWVKPLEYDDYPRLFTLVRYYVGRLRAGH